MVIISIINKENERKVFEYNDTEEEFKEIEIIDKNVLLYQLLDQDSILLFIDDKHKLVWMWIGRQCSPKMKVGAAQSSYHVRDRYAFGFKISTVDEGDDEGDKITGFKIFMGLEEEDEIIQEQAELQYKGTAEEEEIFETISDQQILRILEKTEVPDGYERIMVIVNNDIYLYKVYPHSLGADIKQKKLFRRKEELEDGWYLLEDYTPRILFSSNNLLMIELLRKVKDNNNYE